MKEKIEEVQQYFKNKLLSGDFEITEISENLCKIKVDSEYIFTIWIGNLIKYSTTVKPWNYGYNDMIVNLTDDESIQFQSILKTPVLEYHKNTLINKKREELENLIKESESE